MRKALLLLFIICLAALLVAPLSAREKPKVPKQPFKYLVNGDEHEYTDPGLQGLAESAAVDTYCIVWYNFEPNSWQGWTRLDLTAQVDTFFHVDDFSGLNGGSYGGLVPIEGTKSMWCGARPSSSDPYICAWKRAPGYGNEWIQYLVSDAISFAGSLTFSYRIAWDNEPDYDYTYVEYDAGGGNWQELAAYTADGSATESYTLILTQAQTKLRFRFVSDFLWSDEDGDWNTDGAVIVDELRVRDLAGLDNYQNFESAPVLALNAGIWHARVPTPYGTYSGLRSGLVDKDPCADNFTSQVVFFVGSPNPSSRYPGLYDTPFCAGPGGLTEPCQYDFVVSPIIDMKKYSTAQNSIQNGTIPAGDLPLLGGCQLRLSVYRDLDYINLVFYKVYARSVSPTGCWGAWQNTLIWHFGTIPVYHPYQSDFSSKIGWSDRVQIALGVEDLCEEWYEPGGCMQHTPSPWFDDVRLFRYKSGGLYLGANAFHDNFPSDEFDMESTVRCDLNWDINDPSDPETEFFDYVDVFASSPFGGGIATDPTIGGPAVYMHVRATYIGPAPYKPNLHGPTLAGSSEISGDPPTIINHNYVSDDGVWTIIQCDNIGQGNYLVDLNDDLFTRGYQIEYYFTARDNAGAEKAVPKFARSGPPYYEMTCLPTLNSNVLYMNIDRAEEYWRPVFDAVLAPPNNQVDVYHYSVPGPTGPGSASLRAKNAQLTSAYDIIVWAGGLSDGTPSHWGGKENDCQMLIDWMSVSPHQCGLWISCDDAAYYLDSSTSASALALMGAWCGVDLVTGSYHQLTGGVAGGGIISPLLTGDGDAGIFVHGGVPDKFYIYGGCPTVNEFDVLEKTGTAQYALNYPSYAGTNYYAGIANQTVNSGGFAVRTMWFGFDYNLVRDNVLAAPMDIFHIADDVFTWFQSTTNADVTKTETPRAYRLAQNFPNPFNPSTTITFDMKEKGLVTVKIYNVAGQLVRTLTNGVREAGSYRLVWDGRSERGAEVSSGIYFYKMETGAFSATKKLVLLR